jgi:hypothetical protein
MKIDPNQGFAVCQIVHTPFSSAAPAFEICVFDNDPGKQKESWMSCELEQGPWRSEIFPAKVIGHEWPQ